MGTYAYMCCNVMKEHEMRGSQNIQGWPKE